MFLEVEELSSFYGLKKVLFGVSLSVGEKEIVTVIGPNGSGKTTTLRSIFGIHKGKKEGRVVFDGRDYSTSSCVHLLRAGMCYVTQGAKTFPDLTVLENLRMGAILLKDKREKARKLENVYKLFPILKRRQKQIARTLSGGERQMLSIGMSMMLTPRILLLDEPSIGLSPMLVPKLMEAIRDISVSLESSVLIVEQNARQVLKISDRVYVMKVGRITDSDRPEKFQSKEEMRKVYLSDVASS
jgi:branched-chain amino acid transport system ATP-binding protein